MSELDSFVMNPPDVISSMASRLKERSKSLIVNPPRKINIRYWIENERAAFFEPTSWSF